MSSSAETCQKLKSLLIELPEERADAARLDELRRFFSKLIATGELSFSSTPSSSSTFTAATKWNAFLQNQHASLVSQLCQRVEQGKKTAVRTLFGVIAASPSISRQGHLRVNDGLVHQWTKSMTALPNMDKAMRIMVEGEFLQYRDVQYYALVAIAKLAAEQYQAIESSEEVEEEMELAAERLFQLLVMIPIPTTQEEMEQSNYLFESSAQDVAENDENESDDEQSVATNESKGSDEDDNESSENDEDEATEDEEETNTSNKRKRKAYPQRKFTFEQLKSHKKALSNAWLSVLKLPLATPALKSALQFLPSNIIPHVPNPLLFGDFFMQAYSHGGVIGVLALDGLFLLMTQYGLEYPLFYTSLYRLVQPNMFYTKFRVRFFELLEKCLARNSMLPAHVVASFCKRLLRCACNAPPPGILFILALVANLLRKHEECAALIHRDNMTMEDDPFDAETNDPTQTRALESCLWELSALSHHYYPPVVTLAKSIGTETATTPMHDMHDFGRHTYKSLFEQERKRTKKRQKVPLTFVEPKGLFGDKDDVLSGMLNLPTAGE